VLNDAPTIQAFVVCPPPFGSPHTGMTGQSGATLTATLDFGGGKVASFTALAARISGRFTIRTTGIHQLQLRAVDPAFPHVVVLFCPDVDGKRQEVIVGYGNATVTPPELADALYRDDQGRRQDALHSHGSEALHVRGVALAVGAPTRCPFAESPESAGLDSELPTNRTTVQRVYSVGGPMTLPRHIDPKMGGPGDNNQIGLLTAAGASYMAEPSEARLTTLLTEAESVGTWPIHFYKPDGSMVDVKGERTFFSEFGGYGNFVVNEPPFSRDAAYVLMDSAHQYASANAAWLLTGDPYYLRCMQGVTNSHLLQDGYHRINQKLDGLLYLGRLGRSRGGCAICRCSRARRPSLRRSGSSRERSGKRASTTTGRTRRGSWTPRRASTNCSECGRPCRS
jgi:hypothetical protein